MLGQQSTRIQTLEPNSLETKNESRFGYQQLDVKHCRLRAGALSRWIQIANWSNVGKRHPKHPAMILFKTMKEVRKTCKSRSEPGSGCHMRQLPASRDLN
jgi:hypothetical protein